MINRRHRLLLLLIMLAISCNSSNTQEEATDSIAMDTSDEEIRTFVEKAYKDSVLLAATDEILKTIRDKDYGKLAGHFHPEAGVRFSPYGYIDTTNHVHFTSEDFLKQLGEDQPISWGSYDGTGKDIRMSLEEYFDKFVYEEDFLNAEQVSVNEILGTGNSLINIDQVYPGSDFTESHFPGFEEKYGGMDWRSLRLVFQIFEEEPYLVGIVHDQWTI